MPSAANARMDRSFKAFNAQSTAFTRKLLPSEFVKFHKKIALTALRGIVNKTPVLTGRAAGNWQLSINTPANDIIDNVEGLGNQAKGKAISEGMDALVSLKPFEIIWISNNVPYILELEGGSSTKAPRGMVAVTFEEMLSIFGP